MGKKDFAKDTVGKEIVGIRKDGRNIGMKRK